MTAVEPVEPVETPEAPEGEVEAPPEFILPEDFATTVQAWDIPLEDLPTAVELHKALQTEEGVIDTFVRTGQALGFGTKDLERLFADEAPVPAVAPTTPAPAAEPADPDQLMTRAEFEAEIERRLQPIAEQRQQDEVRAAQERQQRTNATIDSWFDGKEVEKDVDVRNLVAGFAAKHIVPGANDHDPAVLSAALERGLAEYTAWENQRVQSYLKKKGGQAAAQPTPLGGGGTSAGEGDDTPNYAELRSGALSTAKERVRARLRASGELG